MNQDQSTAVRGAVAALTALAAAMWPEHAKGIAESGALVYGLLAIAKPWLPVRVRQAFGG